MAFQNKIDYCLDKQNDEYYIVFKDITDVFDAVNNPSGWEDVSTIEGGDVVSALIKVYDPEGTETIIDVTSQIPSTVGGIITFSTNHLFNLDGYYKVLYIIETTNATYTACKEKYFYPNTKCCISNFIKKVVNDPNNATYQKELVKIKAWEKAFQAAAETLDTITANKILNNLKTFCKHNPCGCK